MRLAVLGRDELAVEPVSFGDQAGILLGEFRVQSSAGRGLIQNKSCVKMEGYENLVLLLVEVC